MISYSKLIGRLQVGSLRKIIIGKINDIQAKLQNYYFNNLILNIFEILPVKPN